MKAKLYIFAVKFVMVAIALGIGIWYLDSSIGGAALTYSSTRNFMTAIGAANGDIANVNGCFLCGYVRDLFHVIGGATENFWRLLIDHLWILLAVGFGIFLIVYSGQYLYDAMKKTGKLDTAAKNLELKGWFDKVWRQGARVLFVGALIGALGMGGTGALRTITNITVTPVIYVGAELAMVATGTVQGAACTTTLADNTGTRDILNPVLQPFLCIMGNLNSIMLAGAAGGFALMNYSWLGLGGGVFTWLAGLGVVLMFLVIGFDLFFKVLSVIFKVIFLIIFMPLFLAAVAFEPVWDKAKGLLNTAINKLLIKSAVSLVGQTLKIVILFALISFAADTCFPGPNDGYSAIFPPLLGRDTANIDAMSMSVAQAFEECETVSLRDGVVDAELFKPCFLDKKSQIESVYPGAFDFMDDGWDFIMLMFGICLLYFYAIGPRVDSMLTVPGKEDFDFGGWVKDFGKTVWDAPRKMVEWVGNAVSKK